MKSGELGDRCPACGAPKMAFEPYTDRMSTRRRRELNLHLHPIAVHFPTTLAVASFVFSVVVPFLAGDLRTLLTDTTRVLVFFVPIVTLIAGAFGYVDGRVRLRKLANSKILQRKILYSSLLFVVSVVTAATVWAGLFGNPLVASLTAFLGAIEVVLVFRLAQLGTSIVDAAFPG